MTQLSIHMGKLFHQGQCLNNSLKAKSDLISRKTRTGEEHSCLADVVFCPYLTRISYLGICSLLLLTFLKIFVALDALHPLTQYPGLTGASFELYSPASM
jgi:hypothetical protein